jgi:hypothetical protein
MPIRRLNYTSRRKLSRDQVRISLTPMEDGGHRAFTVELKLPDDLPGAAPIFVEAYRTSPAARMRFALGTVDAPRQLSPEECRLTEFAGDLTPLFRVKVRDPADPRGALLADVQRIQPVVPDNEPDRRQGILYTGWRDNEGLPWMLEIDDALGPHLYIDERADPLRELPATASFRALVYPEVLRRTLEHILQDRNSMDDPEAWGSRWIMFPRNAFGFTEPPPSDGDGKEWVDDAVRWCARKAGFIEAIAPKETEE